MTTANFQTPNNKGSVPFPRNKQEWVDKGLSDEGATHRMRQDVFGHDYHKDKSGKPLENGIGSAENQTDQSKEAFARSRPGNRLGYTRSLESAFDPKQAEIDRLTAELAAAKKRKPAKKKTAAAAVEA